MNRAKPKRCRYCGSFECPKHDNCRDKGPTKMKQEEPCIPATCPNGKCRATNECIDVPKRIYLAGPMRGVPLFNFPAFHAAATKLRAEGHIVFNPAERDNQHYGIDISKGNVNGCEAIAARDHGFNLREALAADLSWICVNADAIALLPSWQNSKGARAERATAEALGLEVIEL